MKSLIEFLKKSEACAPALKWLETQLDAQTAWVNCERGDWLLWLLAKLEIDRKKLVLLACKCARSSLHLVLKGEERPRIAIETAEAWARGEATLGEVNRAAIAAQEAVYSASSRASYEAAAYVLTSYASVHAANAAGYAARTADVANAADRVGYAANAAARAADVANAADRVGYAANAAGYAARTAAHAAHANAIRKDISFEEVQKLLENRTEKEANS